MFRTGQILNHTYEIIERIGSGGTSTVFRAKHIRLQKDVVIKRIDTDVRRLGQARTEADILKSLSHRHLPQVYDYFENEGEVYTVIDYIDGINLQQYIEGGNIPSTNQLVKWMKQICSALEYLHEQTPPIIHSDIKPANIMLKDNGDVCLIDFNVSLLFVKGFRLSGFTQNYGSPEQYSYAQNQGQGTCEIDRRTDIYSLGATFYYLMTRTVPSCVPGEKVSIQEYELPYPQTFIDVIDKMMSNNKKDRFSTAGKVVILLDKMMINDKISKRAKWGFALLRVLILVVFIAGCWLCFYGNLIKHVSVFNEEQTKFINEIKYETLSDTEIISRGNELINSIGGQIALNRNENDYSELFLSIANAEERVGNLEYADEYYQTALKYQNISAYIHYIEVLVTRGDYDNAKSILNKGIRLGMEPEDMYYLRGVIKEAEGDLEAAYLEYKKALLSEEDVSRIEVIENAILRVTNN